MALQKRNKINVNFSMSSMSDIVFLLLIFFMLTSTLVSPNALKLLLPSSSSKTLARQTVSVSITENIEYYIGNEKVDTEFLEYKLIQALKGEKEPTVILHVDRMVPIHNAVVIMDIANRQKYKLVLATKPK